jgi:hypothetical protein
LGQDGDIPTEMTVSDIDDVFTILQNNSAEYITNIVEADLKFGKVCAEVKFSLIDLECLAA